MELVPLGFVHYYIIFITIKLFSSQIIFIVKCPDVLLCMYCMYVFS